MMIIEQLESLKVNVVVSNQFGKNTQVINNQFIPVVIRVEKPNQIIPLLKKNTLQFINEINNREKKLKRSLFKTKNYKKMNEFTQKNPTKISISHLCKIEYYFVLQRIITQNFAFKIKDNGTVKTI